MANEADAVAMLTNLIMEKNTSTCTQQPFSLDDGDNGANGNNGNAETHGNNGDDDEEGINGDDGDDGDDFDWAETMRCIGNVQRRKRCNRSKARPNAR